MNKCALFFIALLLLTQSAIAQSTDVGFMIGVSIYNGDLSPELEDFTNYFNDIRPAGTVFVRKNFHPKLALRGSFTVGYLVGDDEGSVNESRQLDFKSILIEAAGIIEVHPFRNTRWSAPYLSPYLFGGVAGFYFNPKTDYNGETVELQPIGTEGQGLPNYNDPYSRVQVSLPMGVGLHLQINDRFGISGELGGRYLFTDYLDDVGSTEVNYSVLVNGNGIEAGELSIRNPNNRPTELTNNTYQRGSSLRDWYYVGGISLFWKIQDSVGTGIGCPGF